MTLLLPGSVLQRGAIEFFVSIPVQTGTGAYLASSTMRTEIPSRGQSGRSVGYITNLQLLPR